MPVGGVDTLPIDHASMAVVQRAKAFLPGGRTPFRAGECLHQDH